MDREHRHKVLIRATMDAGGPRRDVCIRDVSSRGVMIQASAPPPRGTYVELATADRLIVGRVIWVRERRCGIRARERIDVSAFVRGIPGPAAAGASPGSSGPRRAPKRARDPEASRALGSLMEYALVGGFVLALAAALVLAAFQAMSGSMNQVSTHLVGGS